jgi:hypothetical protein
MLCLSMPRRSDSVSRGQQKKRNAGTCRHRVGFLCLLGKLSFPYDIRAESPNKQSMLLQISSRRRRKGTDCGLILFLAKQIPCSCLDEDKKNAKNAFKTERCSYCNDVDQNLELKKCNRYKSRRCSSKECQVADWKGGHKKDCEELKQGCEHSFALKASMRLNSYRFKISN